MIQKKYLRSLGASLTLVAMAASTNSSADTILGIYAGAGVWDASIDGSIGVASDSISTGELGIKDEQSQYFYVALEHPVPIIPNIRLQHTTLENDGYAVVEREFEFDGITYPANAPTATKLDLSQTDVTLYYEILDNWVSLDLGLTAKILDGEATILATPEGSDPVGSSVELKGGVPMLYGMARFDLPLSGLYAGGHINYFSYDNSTISDLDIKLGWMFESVLDVGAELGYRQFKLKLEDFDDADGDVTFDGPYLNLAVHF